MQLAFDIHIEPCAYTPPLPRQRIRPRRGDPMPRLDLDIDAPEAVESKAMTLLAEYRTIAADIALFRSRAGGDKLPIMPAAGMHTGGEEDDDRILELLRTGRYQRKYEREGWYEGSEEDRWEYEDKPEEFRATEQSIVLIETIKKYVDQDAINRIMRQSGSVMGSKHKWIASTHRLRSVLDLIHPLSSEDAELIEGYKRTLDERIQSQGDAVKLTQTEALAHARQPWIDKARDILAILEDNKREVGDALAMIRSWWPEEERLLQLQYVQGRSVVVVCSEMCLSERMHRDVRTHAIARFISRCPVMSLTTGAVDGWEKRKRGTRRG